jgi:hypothetical protein
MVVPREDARLGLGAGLVVEKGFLKAAGRV